MMGILANTSLAWNTSLTYYAYPYLNANNLQTTLRSKNNIYIIGKLVRRAFHLHTCLYVQKWYNIQFYSISVLQSQLSIVD